MFYELFDRVIDMSITASVVIVAVFIVRAFMGKMPKRYSYILWIIVAVRLLCPVGLVSSVSVFNLLGEHKVLTTEYWQERSTGNDVGRQDSNTQKQFDDFVSSDKNEDLYPTQEAEFRRESLVERKIDTEEISPFVRYGTIVWLGIAAMLTIWNVISLLLMKRSVSISLNMKGTILTERIIS